MSLTQEELQRIREVRIHSVLGVRDDGRDVSVKCVFHNEKTPSLVIYPDNGYHCFGCNKNGNGAIDFCVDLGYTFVDACSELVKYI